MNKREAREIARTSLIGLLSAALDTDLYSDWEQQYTEEEAAKIRREADHLIDRLLKRGERP